MKVIDLQLIEDINYEIDKLQSEIDPNSEEDINKYSETILNILFKYHNKLNRQFNRETKIINKLIKRKWKVPLASFNLYYHILFDLGEAYFQSHFRKAKDEENLLFFCLNSNFVRCLQITSEIHSFLVNGYPDGAHARWRTLHEISVIMNFLIKHPSSVIPYLDHDIVTSYKSMNQYNKYYNKIDYPPPEEEEIIKITEEYKKVVEKHGKNIKNDYGWASHALGIPNPTMFKIEEDINFDIYRPFYKMACHNVHGGAKGLSFKLGNTTDDYPSLNAGSSIFGFTDPAHTSAISLYHAVNAFFNTYKSDKWDLWINVVNIFSEYIGDIFMKIQQQDSI